MENNQSLSEEQEQQVQTPPSSEDTFVETSSCCSSKSKSGKKSKLHCVYASLSILSFFGVVFLLFSDCGKEQATVAPIVKHTAADGAVRIAYINTDTILMNYEYAQEMEANIKAYQMQLENSYQAQSERLRADYEYYLKNGDKMTLTEQKKKEEELTLRQQKMPEISQEMMYKLQERQMNDNKKLLDAIYAFIRDYNQKHDQYSLILSKSYINSPVLYVDEGMNITSEILEGLNEEYRNVKKK